MKCSTCAGKFRASAIAAVLAIAACFATCIAPGNAGAESNTVRFAYQDRVADAASIIAVRTGLFESEGVHVKPLRFSSGPACAEALYSASADIGTMGDATAVIAAARRAPLIIIASHGSGEHRHRIVLKSGSTVKKPKNLEGKTVAVKKGTSTYGGFLLYLAEKNIDIGGIRVVDMRPADMPEALAAESVDALVASEPTPSLAESRGAVPFATLGNLGNVYPILLLARKRFLKEHPDQTERFLRALSKGAQFVRERPDEAATIISAAVGLDVATTTKAMERHSYELGLDERVLTSLKQTASFLEDTGRIPALPDLGAAIDRKYLDKAMDPRIDK